MSSHLKGYSGYQKRVVKGIADLVGERPFSHERTSNNHLQIKVKGIDRVFYTSSTPSDHRTFENFISDIKSELKQIAQTETQPETAEPSQPSGSADEHKLRQGRLDKMIKTSIKRIRMTIDNLRNEELAALLSQPDQDPALVIKGFRENLIRREIDQVIKNKSKQDYITASQQKECEKTLEENLSFMMPTIACYQEQLGASPAESGTDNDQSNPQADTECSAALTSDTGALSSASHSPAETAPRPASTDRPVTEAKIPGTADTAASTAASGSVNLHQLVKEKSSKRLAIIKELPKNHIEALMADFSKALEQKHQDDVRDLVSQIKERGVSLDELQQALAG